MSFCTSFCSIKSSRERCHNHDMTAKLIFIYMADDFIGLPSTIGFADTSCRTCDLRLRRRDGSCKDFIDQELANSRSQVLTLTPV